MVLACQDFSINDLSFDVWMFLIAAATLSHSIVHVKWQRLLSLAGHSLL